MRKTLNDYMPTIVYYHKNKINNKLYIGITTKLNVEERWGTNGYHYKGQRIYNAIQKYGWDNFEHEIICTVPLWKAKLVEIELIKKYDTMNRDLGYNISKGGDTSNAICKKVNKYDLNGVYLKTYDTITEASKDVKRESTDISACCNGKRHTLANFQWRFYNDVNNTENIKPYKRNIKRVFQYDKFGKLLKIWDSAREASECLNVNRDSIQMACVKKRNSAGGFQWRYETDADNFNGFIKPLKLNGKQVDQFDMDDNYIRTWDNAEKAEKELGISGGSICRCCKGQWKQTKNYKWKYTNSEVN